MSNRDGDKIADQGETIMNQRPFSRRDMLRTTAALALGAAGAGGTAQVAAQNLKKIRFAIATKTVSPIIINILIPEYLGYFKDEGLSCETIPLGSNAAVMAALEAKRTEFGVGVPSFQIPLVAKGEKLPAVNFYEYAYPFKWSIAVKPDSAAKTLTDLRGKKVGVSSFGQSDFPVGKALLHLVKLDPEKDVQWLAVGENITAGQALQRGDIDALMYYDTGFGAIEAAGIAMRYLPLPPNVPKVGGLYISATRDYIKENRATAIGIARATARTQVFIQANPEAAAYAFLQMFPEAAPRAMSVEDQVKAIMVPVVKRMPLYSHYDKSITKWGFISASEWGDEVTFAELSAKVKDTSGFFTNELIDEINKFDAEKVKQDAKNFKLPYRKS